jgi:hypothetical protein
MLWAFWYIVRPFGILWLFCYIIFRFVFLHQEESGNPGRLRRGFMNEGLFVFWKKILGHISVTFDVNHFCSRD